MSNQIFQNKVGTISNEAIEVKDLKIRIVDLSIVQYTTIQNGKIDFFLIITSIILTVISFIIHSYLIISIAISLAVISQLLNIKYHCLIFVIHKNQQVISKEINKVNKKDIELFIKQFCLIKELSQPN